MKSATRMLTGLCARESARIVDDGVTCDTPKLFLFAHSHPTQLTQNARDQHLHLASSKSGDQQRRCKTITLTHPWSDARDGGAEGASPPIRLPAQPRCGMSRRGLGVGWAVLLDLRSGRNGYRTEQNCRLFKVFLRFLVRRCFWLPMHRARKLLTHADMATSSIRFWVNGTLVRLAPKVYTIVIISLPMAVNPTPSHRQDVLRRMLANA